MAEARLKPRFSDPAVDLRLGSAACSGGGRRRGSSDRDLRLAASAKVVAGRNPVLVLGKERIADERERMGLELLHRDRSGEGIAVILADDNRSLDAQRVIQLGFVFEDGFG